MRMKGILECTAGLGEACQTEARRWRAQGGDYISQLLLCNECSSKSQKIKTVNIYYLICFLRLKIREQLLFPSLSMRRYSQSWAIVIQRCDTDVKICFPRTWGKAPTYLSCGFSIGLLFTWHLTSLKVDDQRGAQKSQHWLQRHLPCTLRTAVLPLLLDQPPEINPDTKSKWTTQSVNISDRDY